MSISWQFYEGRYEEVIESLCREKNHNNCKWKHLAQEADIALCEFRKCHNQEFHEKAVTTNHEYAQALKEFPSTKRRHHWVRSVLLTAINGVWLQLFYYYESTFQMKKQLDFAPRQIMMRAFSTCMAALEKDDQTIVGNRMTTTTTTTTTTWDYKNTLWEKWEMVKLKWFNNNSTDNNNHKKKKRNEKEKYVKDQVEHTLRILLNDYHLGNDQSSHHHQQQQQQQQQRLKKEVSFYDNDDTNDSTSSSSAAAAVNESIEREHYNTTTLPQHYVSKALVFYESHNNKNANDDKAQTCMDFFLNQAAKVEGIGSWSYVLYQSIQAMQLIHSKRHNIPQKENNVTATATTLIRKLEPHTSTSILICQIVASLYVKLGQLTNALQLWQTALKLSIDGDVDHRLLISNIAHAFFILRNIPAALEMYLYVLTSSSTSNNHHIEMTNKFSLKVAKSMNIHLSFQDKADGNDDKLLSIHQQDNDTLLSVNTQIGLLRKLYEAALFCGDWVTCITSSEQLLQKQVNNENSIKLAKIFALMQGRRTSLAWKELQTNNNIVSLDNLAGVECQILWYLYKADVSILFKRVIQSNADDNNDDNKDSKDMKQEIEKIHDLTTLSWSLCEKLTKKRKSDDKRKSQIHQELVIAVWNNFGLTWFLKGNMLKAMSSFRKAIQYVQEQQDPSMKKSNNLHVFFNMSLLLWKHGHKQEATKIWLTARGFITTNEAEKPLADGESKRATIERLKRDLQKAIKKNELINEEIKIGKYELSLEPITRWQPCDQRDEIRNPNVDCIAGIQSDQCTAVDVMLLRQMIWYLAREDGSQFLQNSRY